MARRPQAKRGGPQAGRGKAGPKGPGGERIEGRQAVRELLLAGTRKCHEIVMAAGLDPAPILEDIIGLAAELRVPVREVARRAFDDLAHTESAQGVLAEAAPLPTLDIDELIDRPDPFLVLLDGVTDPHNLGAVFRSAEGAGASGLLLPRHRSARVSATAAKSSAGAIEHLPIATVAGVPAAISHLRDRGVWVVGLDEAGSRSVFDLTVADEPICLVFGAEGAGLSRLVRERCDDIVSIPMQGAMASLNVSAAAAIALFEVRRRRSL